MNEQPTNLQVCEAAIVERLKARITTRTIESFPDDPATYKLLHQYGAFLVCFRGSDFSDPESDSAVITDRRMLWDVHVISRQLSGHDGAYAMLDASLRALMGWSPAGFRGLVPVREKFIKRGEGLWIYAQTFSTATVAVQDDDDVDGPLLEQITAASAFGTTVVT